MPNWTEIEVPDGHIYTSQSLPLYYDYGPWAYINAIIKQQLKSGALKLDPCLIDIGANVGDTASAWRSFRDSQIICVEPDSAFFRLLEKNTKMLKECTLINALYNASVDPALLSFNSSGSQTGVTSIATDATLSNCGDIQIISLKEIIKLIRGRKAVFKTDTDGFDYYILADIVTTLGDHSNVFFPIIFSEGPAAPEFISIIRINEWIDLCESIVAKGYNLTLFTNFGHPYCFCGQNIEVLQSAFFSLHHGIANKRPACHYFDLVFTTYGFDQQLFATFLQSSTGHPKL